MRLFLAGPSDGVGVLHAESIQSCCRDGRQFSRIGISTEMLLTQSYYYEVVIGTCFSATIINISRDCSPRAIERAMTIGI